MEEDLLEIFSSTDSDITDILIESKLEKKTLSNPVSEVLGSDEFITLKSLNNVDLAMISGQFVDNSNKTRVAYELADSMIKKYPHNQPKKCENGPPDTKMTVDRHTALVVTDPQRDFLEPGGLTWGVVGKSVTENKTTEHILELLKDAKDRAMPIFISPHYYYPHDAKWNFNGALETLMHDTNMFSVKGSTDFSGLEGSGADFMEVFKPYIYDGETIIASPHKVYGPSNNDLCLQLRKRGINKVILCGMSANLCVESHLRELLEQGFEIAVVRDATAAASFCEKEGVTLDGYQAALTNFYFLANAVWSTEEALINMTTLFHG